MSLQTSVGDERSLKVSANKLFYACTVFFEEAATRFEAQPMAQPLAQPM